MSPEPPPASVRLAEVDDGVLAALTSVATSDAAADEVTPPLTDGPGWSEEREIWFEDYHRRCRGGAAALAGGAHEATWAIVLNGEPVGAVRLQRTDEPGVLETGIWLARGARGRGASVAATRLVLAEAAQAGATAVRADTSSENHAAQALLRRVGFTVSPAAEPGRVAGRIGL